ncbi:hypothetical protein LSUB1_G005284 [Lachnellula subtilissima]|uniref:Uncharacterized protein n=1 Tax=Lachnellula subtilissima TaxID=602034 RepID=A0A8H8RN64_9HELO|nr:hypothetical protein LSUB1_G005284 [Lachnellula subtilissima]
MTQLMLRGGGTIKVGAKILTNVIQAGWTGKAALTKLSRVKERVETIIGAADPEDALEASEEYY